MMEIKKSKAGLVEECFRLSTSDLGKKILYPVDSNRIYLQHEQLGLFSGKSDNFVLASGLSLIKINYQVYFDDPLRLEIFYNSTASQTIFLDTIEIQYGTNVYFLCPCGKRSRILYMKRKGSYFACRECHNLRYELTTFSATSELGLLSKMLHNHNKLEDKKLDIKRIDYDGKPTRKAISMMRLSKKIIIPTS